MAAVPMWILLVAVVQIRTRLVVVLQEQVHLVAVVQSRARLVADPVKLMVWDLLPFYLRIIFSAANSEMEFLLSYCKIFSNQQLRIFGIKKSPSYQKVCCCSQAPGWVFIINSGKFWMESGSIKLQQFSSVISSGVSLSFSNLSSVGADKCGGIFN